MKKNYNLKCIRYVRGGTVIQYYSVTTNGRIRYYTKYEKLEDGVVKVMKNGKWGFLNNEGNIWGKMEFSKIHSEIHEGFVRVEKGGKFGYADLEAGRFIDCIYDSAEDFKNGKVKALQALFGACMKELKGAGDPAVIKEMLEAKMK